MINAERKVKHIKASQDLPRRVGAGRIDENVIEKAQKVIDETEIDFGPLAENDLSALLRSIETAKSNDGNNMEAISKDSVLVPIMNLKANAGSFHYQLVSEIGSLVLNALEKTPEVNKEMMEIVELLYQSIHLIIVDNMKGNGGKKGRELDIAFRELCNNYEKSLPA